MATITTPPSRARLQLRMLGNEILKGLQVTWHHRATLLPQAAFVTLV